MFTTRRRLCSIMLLARGEIALAHAKRKAAFLLLGEQALAADLVQIELRDIGRIVEIVLGLGARRVRRRLRVRIDGPFRFGGFEKILFRHPRSQLDFGK
jgi:hypothetical protein